MAVRSLGLIDFVSTMPQAITFRTGSFRKILAIVATLATCAGCTRSLQVQVDTQVPTALVASAPVSVGIYYDDKIRNHIYEENSPERVNWAIQTGQSQVAMFDRVLQSTFDNVSHISAVPTRDHALEHDMIIAPAIRELQLATPQETFFDFYEAWIRYDIDILERDGTPVGTWQITAYGKAPKKRFARQAEGISDAVGLALRDAGAKLATGILKQPSVARLIRDNQ